MSIEVFNFPMENEDTEGVMAMKLPPGYIKYFFNFIFPQHQILYISNDKQTGTAEIYAAEIDGVDYGDESESPTPGQLASLVMTKEFKVKSLESGQSHQIPVTDASGWQRLLVIRNGISDEFKPVRN